MQPCPLPVNESERLAAVQAQRILDTPPEPEFDVTTRIASHLFDAPIALVALMDRDRLWFKSKYGLDLEQLDRQIAFCAHAIVHPQELLVIEDLSLDPRFADNPLVQGSPGLRFYAGAPLVEAEEFALGTIAVLGLEPRHFGAEERALLRDLSVSVMSSIHGRRRALELQDMATTDLLTGLPNRMQFQTTLVQELQQGVGSTLGAAVFYIDLDGFKEINDRFGHAAGDAVLREVGHRLRPQIRSGDTLARLGGDEFALVMRPGVDEAATVALAERLVEVLKPALILPTGEAVSVGLSIGIALQQGDRVNAEALLQQADHALYRAKLQPAQRWHLYHPSPPIGASTPFEHSDSSSPPSNCEACVDGIKPPFPFTLAFQPIVSASQRSVFAYEALARGVAGEPAITVLERVTRRNQYAFDQSCRCQAIALATRLGLLNSNAKLSINFLPGAMYEPENCIRATVNTARRFNLPLERLIFELTEGEKLLEPQHIEKIFQVYRHYGFMPAIDDFGAGYSGLNLLAEIQPDLIKLDAKLVRGIEVNPVKQSIVRGMLHVCQDLGIIPIAEAVETLAEYQTLREMGVDLYQGYLFARPAFEALPEPVFPAG